MPAITAITLRFSRKFQISRDDWIGADALVTVAVGEEEAESADPAEIRRIAIAEARQVVIESIAAEYLERTQLAARAHAGQLPAGQTAVAATAADRTADVVGAPLVGAPPPLVGALPAANGAANDATPPPAPIANGRPATAEEAERRFFARYSEIVGGESWLDVWAYLGTRAPKPATVEGWYSAAEAVRDAHRQRTAPDIITDAPTTDAAPIADGEIDGMPASHAEQHTISHQPRPPRTAEQPIPTSGRARSAARRALK